MNKKYFKIILAVSMLLGISKIPQAQAGWFGKPIKGQILDIETKKPIKDVLVIVTWNKQNLLEPRNLGEMIDAREILTDENGNFDFKTKTGIMPNRHVHMFFYKKGYDKGWMLFYNQGRSYHKSHSAWDRLLTGIFVLKKSPEGKSESGKIVSLSTCLEYKYDYKDGKDLYKFAKRIPKIVKILRSRYSHKGDK